MKYYDGFSERIERSLPDDTDFLFVVRKGSQLEVRSNMKADPMIENLLMLLTLAKKEQK